VRQQLESAQQVVVRRRSQESALQWFQQLNSAACPLFLLKIDLQLGKLLLVPLEQLQVFVQLSQQEQVQDPLLLQGHSFQYCSAPLLVLQVCMQRSDQVLK
jgi:hypothetical protein